MFLFLFECNLWYIYIYFNIYILITYVYNIFVCYYEFKWYEQSDLVKLDIFINNERVEALTWVVHRDKAYYLWRDAVEKLKTLIPRQLFAIPIQAGLGTKIIARETISAIKKDVLAKCYGWDVSRKRKLLQKQKEWKKRMKAIWNVEVPTEIFVKMITRD